MQALWLGRPSGLQCRARTRQGTRNKARYGAVLTKGMQWKHPGKCTWPPPFSAPLATDRVSSYHLRPTTPVERGRGWPPRPHPNLIFTVRSVKESPPRISYSDTYICHANPILGNRYGPGSRYPVPPVDCLYWYKLGCLLAGSRYICARLLNVLFTWFGRWRTPRAAQCV